jgi:hypothetical protein
MNAWGICDSVFGDTAKVARAIGAAIGETVDGQMRGWVT